MNEQKAAEIIGYSRQRAKSIGYIIWLVMIVIGILGIYFWNWIAIVITFIIGYLSSSIYSYLETKRVENITGYDVYRMEQLFKRSAVYRRDPVAQNPERYKSYIRSLPDE